MWDAGAPPPSPPDAGREIVRHAESDPAPPPISGGHLALAQDGALAVAVDPDLDMVFVVSLADERVVHRVALPSRSEPGRVIEGARGDAHVALRRSGEIATVDLATGAVERVAVCAAPRGLALRPSDGALVVACADGVVATVAGGAVARTYVADDLRDVVALDDGRMLVTRFRSAEVLTLDADLAIVARRRLPDVLSARFHMRGLPSDPSIDPRTFQPAVAWRMIAAEGGAYVLHQRATVAALEPSGGGYGAGDPCEAIVQSALSFVPADGPIPASHSLGAAVLAVDVAIDASGAFIASPGTAHDHSVDFGILTIASPRAPDVFAYAWPLDTPEGDVDCVPPLRIATPLGHTGGATTAVATSAATGRLALARAPARLVLLSADDSPSRELALDDRVSDHFGHEVFHAVTSAAIACASCHPEGGDDGRTWDFVGIGRRRTQTMRGGLLGTEPFHWDGDMTDFTTLVSHVLAERMGGSALDADGVAVFSRWMDALPSLPRPREDAAAAERGRLLFESPAVGCAACHTGQQLTNHATVDVGTGAPFQVPTLLGIAHRAPYMHDGCAPTLADRLTDTACGGGERHGHTAHLDEAARGDLIAYLRTL